ncbi:hypothetical protein JS756_30525 [Streptomyces actuosus]|uniref:Uncharacterized protein n=1 Tax=Streptomyces actuosus TaxID=1885 RepID=A0ABS2VZ11_STRAS|nr:hypothetical protein [Streptomyces actuosus]MBN0048369.1 hypothetical protein [Streptomyces actuosus]
MQQREVRGQGGDGVEDTVEGDDGCEAPLIGCRARRQVAAEADAEQRDECRVDARVRGEEVQDGADHVLPVRPKDQPVPMDGRGLPGAVEGQDVAPAFLSTDGAEELQWFGSAVESVVHHQRRLRALACRPVEVAVQYGVLIGHLHGSDTPEVGDGITEAGDTTLVGVADASAVGVPWRKNSAAR